LGRFTGQFTYRRSAGAELRERKEEKEKEEKGSEGGSGVKMAIGRNIQ